MCALLLLLLEVGNAADGLDGWGAWSAQGPEVAEERLAEEAGGKVESGAVLAEDGVGVLQVGGGEGLDRVLEGCEAGDDLVLLLVIVLKVKLTCYECGGTW